MTQGYIGYPNSKAAAYNMLYKYVPECTKNKNYSTTMRDRPAIGVSFYQRATPVDGTPVAVINGITDDIITCWRC